MRSTKKSGSPLGPKAPRGRLSARGLAALGMALFGALAGCGGAEPVRLATIGNYPPFDFINEAGEIDGLERELGDELCRRADLRCEWVLNDWEAMIPDLRAGDFDAIIAGMAITDERDRQIDFTEAYYPPSPSVYLARAGAGDEAVEGAVGVTANTIYSDHFTALGRPFVPIDVSIDVIDVLLAGEVDSVLVAHGYAVERLAQHEGRLAVVGPSLLLDGGLGIGVRSGSDLRQTLDEALESMKVDGSLNTLITKWVGPDAATFPPPVGE